MNGLPYYKAYPRDFIEGTVGMSFDLKGAYRLVLDLIYMQGGNLPDDERYIAGLLSLSVRKWKTLRHELISRGKISVVGEFLTNSRALVELESLAKLSDKMAENRARPNKNNELESQQFHHTEPDTDTEATLSSVASAPTEFDDLESLRSKLVEAVGEKNIQPHGSLNLGPIIGLVSAGVSVDLDIVPALRAKAVRMRSPARSWIYFTDCIRDAYRSRVDAGKDLPQPIQIGQTDADWTRRLKFARLKQLWSIAEWGAMPGQPGCLVPSHLLEATDGDGWIIGEQTSQARSVA